MESRVRSSQSAFCKYPSWSRSRHREPNGKNWFSKVLAFAWVDQTLLKMARNLQTSENTAKSFAFFDFWLFTSHQSGNTKLVNSLYQGLPSQSQVWTEPHSCVTDDDIAVSFLVGQSTRWLLGKWVLKYLWPRTASSTKLTCTCRHHAL